MAKTRENPAAGNCGARNAVCLAANNSENSRIDRPPQARFAAIRRLRRQRLVEHLHRLGPAPLGYFLREVENGASIPDHLERYSRIDPAFVRALGGDRFPPALHAVAGLVRERSA